MTVDSTQSDTHVRTNRPLTKLRRYRSIVTDAAAFSHIGLSREENQDSWTIFPEDRDALRHPKGQLFVVADGMGGHARGGEAARLAVHYVQEIYFANESEDIAASLRKAFETANSKIMQCWQNGGNFERMGTTCTAMVLTEHAVHVAHVGDSKAYRITRHHVEKLTEDHTHVAELRRRGILTEEEAENNPRRSELVRALGMTQELEVDLIEGPPPRAGDYYLLCTDGLADVSEEELKLTVQAHDPEDSCRELIELENSRGGADNSTVQVIKVEREEPVHPVPKHSDEDVHRNLVKGAIFILLLIIFFALFQHRQRLRDSFFSLFFKSEADRSQVVEPVGELPQQLAETNPEPLIDEGPEESSSAEGRETESPAPEPAPQKAPEPAARRTAPTPPPVQRRIVRQAPPQPKRDITPSRRPPSGVTDAPVAEPDAASPDLSASGWYFPGLVEYRDYVITRNGFTLLNSVGLKKAIYNREQTDFDFEVTFSDLSDLQGGEVGVFVGYKRSDNTEYYYQVYLKQNGDFALVKYYDYKRERIRPLDLQLKRVAQGPLHLRVRCAGTWIIIYANGELVNAWQNTNQLLAGKVGVFVGSEKRVAFSNIRVRPMPAQVQQARR